MREKYINKRFLKEASDEHEATHYRSNAKIKKMRQGQRSERGRTSDDWIWDTSQKISSDFIVGRVIEVQKKHIFVAEEDAQGVTDTGLLWLCTVAKRHFQRLHKERNFVVVGDRVLFNKNEQDAGDENLPHGLIQHLLPRKNHFSRRDPLNAEWQHIMLTNIDLIVIVAAVLRPEVRWGLIDRMLVQAEMEKIPVVIVLNKLDLLHSTEGKTQSEEVSADFLQKYQEHLKIYRDIGYKVFEVSAFRPETTKKDIMELRKLIKGKLVGFSGHSGVGKSSIINLFKPEFEQIVDENPDIFYKGRHTTTYNSLLHLGIGAYAIDTPGVRSFNISSLDAITLTQCFKEFAPLSCRYRGCCHWQEEDCGVKAALAEGVISQARYRSFLGILKGISFREGQTTHEDSLMIADLNARQMAAQLASISYTEERFDEQSE